MPRFLRGAQVLLQRGVQTREQQRIERRGALAGLRRLQRGDGVSSDDRRASSKLLTLTYHVIYNSV